MKGVSAVFLSGLLLTECFAEERYTSCDDHVIVENTFAPDDAIPQFYLKRYSPIGLPKSGSLRLAMLSEKQLTMPSFRAIDFWVPGGCIAIDKLVLPSSELPLATGTVCFESSKYLRFIPSPPNRHLCEQPFCAEDRDLRAFAESLNVISRSISVGDEQLRLGSIVEAGSEYKTEYQVFWQDPLTRNVPLYRLSVTLGEKSFRSKGVHARRYGNRFSLCGYRSVADIVAGDEK